MIDYNQSRDDAFVLHFVSGIVSEIIFIKKDMHRQIILPDGSTGFFLKDTPSTNFSPQSSVIQS